MASTKLDVAVLISLQDKLTRPLKSMGDGFKRFGRTLSASQAKFAALNAQMKAAGARSMAVGKKMTRRLTLPILALGGAAIKAGMDFNKGMANVATLIPGNTQRIKELSDNMLKLSTETGATTQDLTAGLYQVVSAFGDAADTSDKMRIAVKAATAGVATTTDAINLLSAVTKGYGDTSAAALKTTSDLAFTTVKLGQTTFPELAASMGQVVPLASALNIKQQELFATMATLTGVTGNTSEVATQMRAAMAAMLKPTTEMKKAIKSLGFSSADAMLKQDGLVGSLRKLVGTTDGTKGAVTGLFGRIEATGAVMALTGKQAKDFDTKLKQIQKSAGATNEAFDAQTKGVNKAGFTWKRMIATLKVLAIKAGQVLLPIFSKIVGALSDVFAFITKLPGPVKTFLVALAGIAAVAGPVLMLAGSFLKLRRAFRLAKLSFKLFGNSIAMNPVFLKIGLIVGAIGAIVAIFSKTKIEIKENLAASKSLASEVDGLAKAYGKAGAAAKKLTAEQRDQMKLRLIEAGEKAGAEMEKNYSKQVEVMNKLSGTTVGSREYIKGEIQLRQLKRAQQRNIQTVTRSEIAMGASKTQAQAHAKQQASSAFGSGLSSAEQVTWMENERRKQSAQQMQGMVQQLIQASQKEVNGKIFVHIKSDGTAAATASFPGSKIGASVSAQSVKNGRTRK